MSLLIFCLFRVTIPDESMHAIPLIHHDTHMGVRVRHRAQKTNKKSFPCTAVGVWAFFPPFSDAHLTWMNNNNSVYILQIIIQDGFHAYIQTPPIQISQFCN